MAPVREEGQQLDEHLAELPSIDDEVHEAMLQKELGALKAYGQLLAMRAFGSAILMSPSIA